MTVEKLVACQTLPLKKWKCNEGGLVLSATDQVSQLEENFQRYICSWSSVMQSHFALLLISLDKYRMCCFEWILYLSLQECTVNTRKNLACSEHKESKCFPFCTCLCKTWPVLQLDVALLLKKGKCDFEYKSGVRCWNLCRAVVLRWK